MSISTLGVPPPWDPTDTNMYDIFVTTVYGASTATYHELKYGLGPYTFGPATFRTVIGELAYDSSKVVDPLARYPDDPGPQDVNDGSPEAIARAKQWSIDKARNVKFLEAVSTFRTYFMKLLPPAVITIFSQPLTGMSLQSLPAIMAHMNSTYNKRGPGDISDNNRKLATPFVATEKHNVADHIAYQSQLHKVAARLGVPLNATAMLAGLADTVRGSQNGRFDPTLCSYATAITPTPKTFADLSLRLIEVDKWHAVPLKTIAFGTANAAVAEPPPEASAAVSLPPHLTTYTVNLSRLNVDERAIFTKLAAKARGGPSGNNGQGAAATGTREPIACTMKGPDCKHTFIPINDHIAATGKCKPCWEADIKAKGGFGKR